MSRFLSICLLLVLISQHAYAQPNPGDPAQLLVPITLTDGVFTETIHFGLDVRATDGLDTDPGLGENVLLPPQPPAADGRFYLTPSDWEAKQDIRFGNGNDQQETYILILREAPVNGSSDMITLSWDLPDYVTGVLRGRDDGPEIEVMNGSGSATVQMDPIEGDLTVQMDISYTGIPDGLLPVELTSFSALVQESRAVLHWETASELNNAGFEVQQAVNGTYRTIGFVQGRGTTNETQRYSFRTRRLAAGSHDFRLKQIDFDGKFAYSHAVFANVALVGSVEMERPYPNPFNPQTQFNLTIAREQDVTIKVYDMLGRQVQTLYQGTLTPSEAHLFTFQAGNLPSGRYLIRAAGQYFNQTQSVTLLK